MNIGEEEEPMEFPIPVDPAKVPIHEPAPVAVPVPEKVGAKVSYTERETWAVCGRG